MRILVMGYSGSGKSTLASALGKKYHLPVLHLDYVHFQQNGKERPDELALHILKPYMAQTDWVIDGNYTNLALEDRLDLADKIIILMLPRFLCLHRVCSRYRKYKNNARPSIAAGCKKKIDLPSLWWVLVRGRKQMRPIYQEILEDYPDKTIVFRSSGAVKKVLKQNFYNPLPSDRTANIQK